MPTVARTRVLPPPPSPHIVPRPHLLVRLDALAENPIAAIVAVAGDGKTSLLAVWADRRRKPTAWYSIAESDDDLYVFLTHLMAAVAPHAPALQATLDQLTESGVADQRWRPALDALLNAAPPGLAIILDDAHRLTTNTVLQALTYLLDFLPPGISIVLGTRRPLNTRAWSGWVLRGRLQALEAADMAFTRDEVNNEDLWRATAGWPLAVDFLSRSGSKQQPSDLDLLQTYIADEVWADLDDADRAFLLHCAPLDPWTAPLCAHMADRADAAQILKRLAGATPFVHAAGDEAFRVHQIFLDFLRLRLAEDAPLNAKAHARAAAALGDTVDAVPHLVSAGQANDAVALLERHADTLLQLGRAERLLHLADVLPQDHAASHRMRGDALRRLGQFEPALAAYELAGRAGAEVPALLGAARVYLDTLQPTRADALLRRAFRLTPREDDRARANVLTMLAENCVNQGRANAALRYRLRALRCAHPGGHAVPRGGTLDARILLRSGDLAGARAALQVQAPQAPSGDAHRENVLILSYVAALQGDAATAEAEARRGLEIATQTQSAYTETVAWMRLGHALQIQGKLNEALDCYDKALAQAPLERVRVEALMGTALACAAQGDVPRSYAAATEGMTIASTAGDAWLAGWLRLAAGIAALQGGHPTAMDVLQAARADLAACRDTFGTTVADLWMGSHASGAPVRARGYEFLLERPTLFGPRTPPAATESKLRIQALGAFRVWRDGVEVPASAWKRQKAKELFLLLLVKRGTPLQKEQLMDALWPDATPQAANRDFRVALHALSDALDPDRPKNALARWIERRGTAYVLPQRDDLELDVDAFQRLLAGAQAEGEAAAEHRRRAVSAYSGDFLEEFPYHDAFTADRERLRQQWLEAAGRLARDAVAAGDDDAALRTAHAVLERDRCWEEAWRVMLSVHGKRGQAALAARAYEQCTQALEEELGVAPGAETRRLWKEAISGTTQRSS